MKYADSFHHAELITVTGKTTYSDWFDIAFANELHSYQKFEESETGSSESIVVTLERFCPLGITDQAVLAHGAIAAAGTSDKEAHYPAEQLGTRVRYKFVSSGTFASDQIVTITMVLHAKRN